MQLIYYIATHPEYSTIVIDEQENTPMEAIEWLSWGNEPEWWSINGTLEKGTLFCYNKHN